MKRLAAALAAICLALNLSFCHADTVPADAPYVLYAVTAGKADALILKADGRAFLIDTGYTRSRGKILYAMETLGIEKLDAVFITHTDKDHTDGLEWLAQSDLEIGAWYAPAFYTGVKESKHPAVKAAAVRGEQVVWLRAGDSFELGDAVLDVLAPGVLFEDKDDNNSLVMMLRTPYGNILLCGDMEYRQEDWLMNSGADIRCDVIKIPNHADDDTCSAAFIEAASPSVAVISTDTREKEDTPYPPLLEMLYRNCGTVLQTQETTGGIAVTLSQDGIRTCAVELPEASFGVEVTGVDPSDDIITLKNNENGPADLSGWYMLTDRKNAFFVFPGGTVLQPGQSLTVGSRNAGGYCDLVWDEKKPVNRKKNDGVTLYDPNGHAVSYMGNGIR